MHVAIIGAGPTGLFLGAALARRGHRVTAVDRDPGPPAEGRWARRGVMQFHHAHGFRPQIAEALVAELPTAYDTWLAAGAERVTFPLPDGRTVPGGVLSRRELFERVLRAAVVATPGFTLRCGHVDAVTLDGAGDATGLRVDGADLPADLVIDASGRAGRATRSLRAPAELDDPTGVAYVDRVYRLRPGAERGPLLNPIAWQADLDGYQTIVFPHEHGSFSVLIVRPTDDPDLALLRHEAAFDAACAAIPGLDVWTDPQRSTPISPVMAGGELVNRYRGQAAPDGTRRRRLVAVGDAVATTTPMFGRGITTSLLQARELLRLLDEGPAGRVPDDLVPAFDAWCEREMRPWVDDHARLARVARERWAGADVDLDAPLCSTDILAAAEVAPAIRPMIGPYLGMQAGPASLAPAEPLARAVYASGWRPRYAPGPSRAELAALVRATVPATPAPA